MSQFTPAPWEVDHHKANAAAMEPEYHTIEAKISGLDKWGVVADTLNCHHCIDPDEAGANARLMAAAPELLSVALGVLVALQYPRGSEAQVRCLEEVGQHAILAIAKARGEVTS